MSQGDLFDPAPAATPAPPTRSAATPRIKFISAGAGSGKTYRLTEELEVALTRDGIEPARVIGTTFTVKAAAELNDRVRLRLIESGEGRLAERLSEGLIGTVHSVCERLLQRFCFELGLSPALNVVSLEDGKRFFDQALDQSLDVARVRFMNATAHRLGIEDWQGAVRAIVDAARSNDVDASALSAMGRRNADDLLAFFPEPTRKDLDRGLFVAVKAAADGLPAILNDRTTKTTRAYLDRMHTAIYRLRRNDLSWPGWIALALRTAGKGDGGDAYAAVVRAAAADYARHPGYQRDIRRYTESVFAIAGDVLAAFQAIKAERGLIDFTDMEQQVLHALDVPAVRERLGDELDLLLVDEFQDTNPMQLALFMKLLPLARRAIFVGDVKQAIYAFRGSDPDLVFATLEGLSRQGGVTDTLPYSWRSRPPLVAFTNALFGGAFERDGMSRDSVELTPKRSDSIDTQAVASWRIDAKGDARWIQLGRAIAAKVAEQMPVVDAQTGAARALRFGDIAVLAATNNHVEAIARALRQVGVPMKMSLAGLLAVPEIVLARACLRRLDDATDTLASAEIVALWAEGPPEAWLADRMRWLERGEPSYAWGEADHPVLAAIARLRVELATRSPLEIVARVLNYVGMRAKITAWGPDRVTANQRQRNLDAFLDLAVQYERHCVAQHEPATLTGFLFWIQNPSSPELDLQPVVTGGDAVHVLTYHKAKGLEWPMVIAADLDQEWRSRLWDVRVEAKAARFDIAAPLSERHIRYWPNPFGRRRVNVDVLATIDASEEGLRCIEAKQAEERRLAYVGLTRARDVLVLLESAGSDSRNAWRDAFDDAMLRPEAEPIDLPQRSTVEPFAPRWFDECDPSSGLLPAVVSPSRVAPAGARVGRVVELGGRIAIGDVAMDALGNALHRIIAAQGLNPRSSDARERAAAVLAGFGVADAMSAESALDAAARLYGRIETLWRPHGLRIEHPVSHVLDNGQIVRGFVDLLVDTDSGSHLVDHKSSRRPRSEWAEEVAEYSGQLRAYRDALVATGERIESVWIHFVITGALVEVVLD